MERQVGSATSCGVRQSILQPRVATCAKARGFPRILVNDHVKTLHPLQTYQTGGNGKVTVNRWYRDGKRPLSSNGIAVVTTPSP